MLSDRERETLRGVQRRFEAEDPDFTRSFDDVGTGHSTCSLHWVFAQPRWAYTTAITVAVALALLMLLARDLGTAMMMAVPATVVWLLRLRRDEAGQREP